MRGWHPYDVYAGTDEAAIRQGAQISLNTGEVDQLEHDARYDHAYEYLEVLYKLWEGSWERDAVRRDKDHAVFADPSTTSTNRSATCRATPSSRRWPPSVRRPATWRSGPCATSRPGAASTVSISRTP